LNTTVWKGSYPFRTQVKYSYVYWIHPLVKDVMWNALNSNSYFSLYSTTQVYPTSFLYPAQQLCQQVDATMAEVYSAADNDQLTLATVINGRGFIGGVRTGPSVFGWLTARP